MTYYVFTFQDEDDTVIVEKRFSTDQEGILQDIEDAVVTGQNLATERKWRLIKVEQK